MEEVDVEEFSPLMRKLSIREIYGGRIMQHIREAEAQAHFGSIFRDQSVVGQRAKSHPASEDELYDEDKILQHLQRRRSPSSRQLYPRQGQIDSGISKQRLRSRSCSRLVPVHVRARYESPTGFTRSQRVPSN